MVPLLLCTYIHYSANCGGVFDCSFAAARFRLFRALLRAACLAEPAAECSWRLTGVALAAAALLADARIARGVPSGSVSEIRVGLA